MDVSERQGKPRALLHLSLGGLFRVGLGRVENSPLEQQYEDAKASGGRRRPSGGAVDPTVLQNLVYPNHICADQGRAQRSCRRSSPVGVPNFDIRDGFGMTGLPIRDNEHGRALAETMVWKERIGAK
jgi:hypothetical protein